MESKTVKILLLGGLVLAMAALAASGAGRWLSANIFTDTDTADMLTDELDKFHDNFVTKMDAYLKNRGPGKFDPDKCEAERSIVTLVATEKEAYGLDKNSREKIQSFENCIKLAEETDSSNLKLQRDCVDKVENETMISWNLYFTVLDLYFLDNATRLAHEDATQDGGTVSITAMQSSADDLSIQVSQEMIKSKMALKMAMVFLTEEHRAATLIGGPPGQEGGICLLQKNLNDVRKTLKRLHGDALKVMIGLFRKASATPDQCKQEP